MKYFFLVLVLTLVSMRGFAAAGPKRNCVTKSAGYLEEGASTRADGKKAKLQKYLIFIERKNGDVEYTVARSYKTNASDEDLIKLVRAAKDPDVERITPMAHLRDDDDGFNTSYCQNWERAQTQSGSKNGQGSSGNR